MSGLGEIGDQVDALATTGSTEMAGALRTLAAAAGQVRALAAGWDSAVGELAAAARDLGTEPCAPGGPRKSSGFVAVRDRAVVHKRTEVRPVAPHLDQAIAAAVSGDAEQAIALAAMVAGLPEPRQADNYFRATGGQVQYSITSGVIDISIAAASPMPSSQNVAYITLITETGQRQVHKISPGAQVAGVNL